MKKLLLVLLILSVASTVEAKWYHYAIAKSAQPQQSQVQQGVMPPPSVPKTHSQLMCKSWRGADCWTGSGNVPPARFAGQSGYKYIHKTTVIPNDEGTFLIYMEVSN